MIFAGSTLCVLQEMTATDGVVQAKLLARMEKLFSSGMEVSQFKLQTCRVIKADNWTELKTYKKNIDGIHGQYKRYQSS